MEYHNKAMITCMEPKYLWFLSMSYIMLVMLANWFEPILINLLAFNLGGGSLIFPITYLIAAVIAEVYGYKHARQVIFYGFLCATFFIFFIRIILQLSGPEYYVKNTIFDSLFKVDLRYSLAILISYLCSQYLNVYVIAKIKVRHRGKLIFGRFIAATIFACVIDGGIFCVIACYGVISMRELSALLARVIYIRLCVGIIFLPFLSTIALFLKKLEKLDIYDYQTNFSLLSLATDYKVTDNEFRK